MTIHLDSAALRPGPTDAVPAAGSLYLIEGYVEHGDARGRTLGFPTANLSIDGRPELDGVWAARTVVEGRWTHLATVSIGRRPTYYAEDAVRLVEVHLLDFAGDLYGRHLRVELTRFLRHQTRCSSEEELITLIAGDVQATHELAPAAPAAHHGPGLGLVWA